MLAAMVALTMLVLGRSALAEPVSFTTTGTFGGPASAYITYIPNPVAIDTPSAVTYGRFQLIALPLSGTISDTFTLNIFQSVPTPTGIGTTTASVSGTLVINSSDVNFDFTPNAVPVGTTTGGTVTYLVQDTFLSPPTGGPGPFTTDLNGFVRSVPGQAVPVPAAVWGGVSLLGLLGGGRLWKRRYEVA